MSYGLVLEGGGAKGAYQIGVWKAFRELGITGFSCVAGTSVGAINAFLYSNGEYDVAKELWDRVCTDFMLSKNSSLKDGIFSRDGFINLFRSYEYKSFVNNKFNPRSKVFVTVQNRDNNKCEYVLLNNKSKFEVEKLLLASSSIPILYGDTYIDGVNYYDAGLKENCPINPVYKENIDEIFIIALNNNFSEYKFKNYKNSRFILIKPSENLGGLFSGTLDFSESSISYTINLGYSDTLNLLGRSGNMGKGKRKTINLNIEIKNILENNVSKSEQLEKFINQSNFSNPNIESKTLGGDVWYINLFSIDGWRLQQHKIMPNHYRILDNNNIRRAWILDPDILIFALRTYFGE